MKRLAVALACALLAACGSAPKSPPGTAKKPAYYADDGPPEKIPADIASIPDAVPRAEPYHRFANRPYVVFGRTYTPQVNDEPRKERGMASWYGKKFHGQKTSSGEIYDMFAMSAAHKTLPIPSYARITSVRDGRSVVVRVNDRGPFHEDRVVDLSYAAAAKLGIAGPGSGLVEIERVFPGSRTTPVAPAIPADPVQTGAQSPAPALDARPRGNDSAVVAPEAGGFWLQLGAFASPENAEAFRERTARRLTWLFEPITVTARDGLHRVRLGPYRSREEASAIADKIRESLGISPALTSGDPR